MQSCTVVQGATAHQFLSDQLLKQLPKEFPPERKETKFKELQGNFIKFSETFLYSRLNFQLVTDLVWLIPSATPRSCRAPSSLSVR